MARAVRRAGFTERTFDQFLREAAITHRQFTESEIAQAKLRAHHEKYGEPEELLAQLRGTLERAQGVA